MRLPSSIITTGTHEKKKPHHGAFTLYINHFSAMPVFSNPLFMVQPESPVTSDCPIPPSDLMMQPVALMSIGGNHDLAPAVMKHNADALLDDRDRLIRWQKWYEKPLN